MSDSFEFTLHNPLTQEDWNKISDAELENTMSIMFQTPQGRQVKYIKCEVLDEIRAEIEKKHARSKQMSSVLQMNAYTDCLQIIDKYIAESEETV